VDDPRLASEVLLANAAGCRRIDLYTRIDRVLEPEPLARFREMVRRAASHEPIAYLVEEKEFFSLRFRVTRDVLVPRAETEELVETAIDLCRAAGWEKLNIWDIGTGSGCIAVAILKQVPGARALATDLFESALEVALENAQRNKVDERFLAVQADYFGIPDSAIPEGRFQLLLCNPPYIPTGQIAKLDRAVRDFEPRGALTDEADGLTAYRIFGQKAARFLADDGLVIVEVGDGAAPAVAEVMTSPGMLVHWRTRKDRTVGKDRVMVFKKQA
jgi:release factor glutamine methyltransferase